MSVMVQWRLEMRELAGPLSVRELFEQLGLPAELYLVVRDGQLLDENEILHDGDQVRLVGVISGGSVGFADWSGLIKEGA